MFFSLIISHSYLCIWTSAVQVLEREWRDQLTELAALRQVPEQYCARWHVRQRNGLAAGLPCASTVLCNDRAAQIQRERRRSCSRLQLLTAVEARALILAQVHNERERFLLEHLQRK